jgi:hypothetical protein
MPTRPVVPHYDPTSTTFGPTPQQVAVKPNDEIQFTIGASTLALHPGSKLRITLHNSDHFSLPVLQHSTAQSGADQLIVRVLPGLAAVVAALHPNANHVITGYKCELLDANGIPIPGLSADGSSGGEIVPDTIGT